MLEKPDLALGEIPRTVSGFPNQAYNYFRINGKFVCLDVPVNGIVWIYWPGLARALAAFRKLGSLFSADCSER